MTDVKFAVPCRFEPELLDALIALHQETGRVGEVYGALPQTVVGSGRPGRRIGVHGQPTWEQVIEFTRRAQAHGISVNYVMNSVCLGNYEFTAEGRRAIVQYLGRVSDAGPDIVTVVLPYLMEVIKAEFPHLRLNVSVLANVTTPQRAIMFERFGVDRISLEYHANRDFEALAEIRRAVSTELELLTNDGCLYACAYFQNHNVISTHAAQAGPHAGDCIDWCLMKCAADRSADPSEILRSPWIRPEDVPWYAERFGVRLFKISGRQLPTEWILRAARAYCHLRYDGNLVDLMNAAFPHWGMHAGTRHWVASRYGNEEAFSPPAVHVDNRALDGFVAAIRRKGGCAGRSHCGTCDLCDVWAKKAVEDRAGDSAARYHRAVRLLMDDVVSGRWTVDGEPANRPAADALAAGRS